MVVGAEYAEQVVNHTGSEIELGFYRCSNEGD
jgi:hypothetical protein